MNCGVNGERSDEIASRFARDVIAAAPRVVIIIAGVNDVYQGRPVDAVTRNLKLMYELARDAGVTVLAGTIVPYDTATPEQNRRMHEINGWIEREAKRDPNVEFVDTRRAVAMPEDLDRLISSPDSLHPSVDGYRRMAEAMRPVLAEAFCCVTTRRGPVRSSTPGARFVIRAFEPTDTHSPRSLS